MKKNFFLAMLVALIFVSCSKTDDPFIPVNESTNQNETGVLNKKDYHEISGKLTYKSSTAFDLDCGDHWSEGYFTDGNYLGQGELKSLGNTKSKTKAWVNFIYGSAGPIGVHIGYQCLSFTAPNGDDLYLSTDGYNLYFNSTGSAVGTCEFAFAGGTGKYTNATGSFKGDVVNPLTGSFTVDLTGKLSYK